MKEAHQHALFLSASSLLGSRPGSVAVRVSGCVGAAWVWCNRHPGHPASLALRIPVTAADPAASARSTARVVAQRFGLRVFVRVAPGGAYWLKCSGSSTDQRAAAQWWARVVRGHSASVHRAAVQSASVRRVAA